MPNIDLRAFKGVFYDLDEIGLALAVARPAPELLHRARKAVARLREFLDAVPDPSIGVYSALASIERCLIRQGQPPKLFDEADLGRRVAEARADLRHLREYCEGLQLAWRLCALDTQQAERAAGRC